MNDNESDEISITVNFPFEDMHNVSLSNKEKGITYVSLLLFTATDIAPESRTAIPKVQDIRQYFKRFLERISINTKDVKIIIIPRSSILPVIGIQDTLKTDVRAQAVIHNLHIKSQINAKELEIKPIGEKSRTNGKI